MKKIIFIIIGLLVFETALALDSDAPKKPFIDKEFGEAEKTISDDRKRCMKTKKKVAEKLNCGREVREQYKRAGKLRGTEEYCRLHYKDFDYQGLIRLRSDLKKMKDGARFDPGVGKKLFGEITKNLFSIELGWIDIRLLEMREQLTKKRHKEVWNKGKKVK